MDKLTDNQLCNHFDKSANITTKVGLCHNLRSLVWFNNVDIDTFYPQCFDVSDQAELQDFITEFKIIKAECVLKQYQSNENVTEERVKAALKVSKRRLRNLDDLIDDPNSSSWDLIKEKEWEILNSDMISEEEFKKRKHENWLQKLDMEHNHIPKPEPAKKKKKKKVVKEEKKTENTVRDSTILQEVEEVLGKLKQKYPQYDINGKKNIWIVKPASLSRGRGIGCYNSLIEILDHVQKEGTWVVQRYIENPMLILRKKFDIRQWVLVTSWNPLTAWFYERCYLRFGVEDYIIDNLQNKFIHLTNNSIQKYSENFENSEIEGSMWHSEELAELLREQTGRDIWEEEIKPKIKKIVKYSLECVQDMVDNRPGSSELYGYDIMLDENYNPWLIEVNASPAMDYSTPVTKELVKQVMEDTIKVMVDYQLASKKKKSKIDTGNFTCLFKSKKVVDRPIQSFGLNLVCEGKAIKS